MSKLTNAEVGEREALVDQALAQATLPDTNRAVATWTLLTATEDVLRLPIIHGDTIDLVQHVGLQDRTKYALKHALAQVNARTPPSPTFTAPKDISSQAYERAVRLLTIGRSYQGAVAAFGAYRDGKADCELDADGAVHFRPLPERDLRYLARDLLEAMARSPLDSSTGSPFMKVIEFIRDPPRPVTEAVRRVQLGRHGGVNYSVEPDVLAFIQEHLPGGRPIIPEGWMMADLYGRTVRRVLHGLHCLAAYHLLITNLAAAKHRIRGAALRSLVRQVSAERLARLLADVAGVGLDVTVRIVDLLRCGARVTTPDPALQPLVPLGERLAFLPNLVLSSSIERNFLALAARVDRRGFDAASSFFEAEMTANLVAALPARGWRVRRNALIPNAAAAGEVDLILIDPTGRYAWLLELWWSLPPGETWEVSMRERTAIEKSARAARKLAALRDHLPDLLTAERLHATDGWRVGAALVSETFLPASGRTLPDVPIVTRATVQHALQSRESLQDAQAWIDAGAWMPVAGRHFRIEPERCELPGIVFVWYGLKPTVSGLQRTRATISRT